MSIPELSQSTIPYLYRGTVSHVRWNPRHHSFCYELSLVMLDLDSLDDVFKGWWPIAAVNRSSFASFRESDHMINWKSSPSQRLADTVRDVVAKETGTRPLPEQRIKILTHLSYFGYCFNPVSFYYIYSASDASRVETIIAEVSNTPWHEMHLYVLNPSVSGVELIHPTSPMLSSSDGVNNVGIKPSVKVHSSDNQNRKDVTVEGAVNPTAFAELSGVFDLPNETIGRGVTDDSSMRSGKEIELPSTSSRTDPLLLSSANRKLRYTWKKTFHVSPFMATTGHIYDWIFNEPGETLLVQSQNICDGKKMLNAQVCMGREILSKSKLLWMLFIGMPFLTWRVQIWIHIEAFRLWWKGVDFYPHPTGATNAFTKTVSAIMTPVMYVASLLTSESASSPKVDEKNTAHCKKSD